MKFIYKFNLIAIACATAVLNAVACSSHGITSEDEDTDDTPPANSSMVKGADVSWITELESKGEKFYTKSGQEKELLQLLRDDCSVEAIRLRVWTNPSEPWNGIDDVVDKAKRVNALGMRLMIDFHYSDTWADPGHQKIPAQWEGLNIDETEQKLIEHTVAVLDTLKKEGITPEWVQIGNEVPDGFLYPLAQASINPKYFARLITAGHKAAKSVFPDIKTIVHVDQGDNNERFKWLFDILKNNNAEYDMIGMSIYPNPDKWKSAADALLYNADFCTNRYGKPVMLCEFGMDYRKADNAYSFMKYLIDKGNKHLDGIFYWEPEAPGGYNGGYTMGCFENGKPTHALDAYTE